jgi:hypothetical protein
MSCGLSRCFLRISIRTSFSYRDIVLNSLCRVNAAAKGFSDGQGTSYPRGEDTTYDSETVFGINSPRPGKSGSNQTGPGLDEAAANEWMPTMPDALKMKDGTKGTMPGQWAKRRAEILEDFDFLEYRERNYRPNPFCVSSG